MSPTVGTPTVVVPGPGLPDGLDVDRSNNNLDVCRSGGRLWLAWRTAPTHFASGRARLHIVSSDDEGATWRHEHTVERGRDVREPRFYEWDGRLHLTWFTAGTRATAFQPDRVWVQRLEADGWTGAVATGPPDTVVWRVRPVGGRPAMSVYRHAGTLFTRSPRPIEVELWRTVDGLTWERDTPVYTGGSETELIDLPDGRVLAVVRQEGSDGAWGSALGVAPADDPTAFRWARDPRKLDSPLLFLHRGRPHLICRKQVAFGGRFDLGWRRFSTATRTRAYQLLYWLTPKRTVLYEVDPDALTLAEVCELPSNGDTAFAGEVPLDDGAHLVFNYSSRTDRGWWPWLLGQLRPTHIYRVRVDPGSTHTEAP